MILALEMRNALVKTIVPHANVRLATKVAHTIDVNASNATLTMNAPIVEPAYNNVALTHVLVSQTHLAPTMLFVMPKTTELVVCVHRSYQKATRYPIAKLPSRLLVEPNANLIQIAQVN